MTKLSHGDYLLQSQILARDIVAPMLQSLLCDQKVFPVLAAKTVREEIAVLDARVAGVGRGKVSFATDSPWQAVKDNRYPLSLISDGDRRRYVFDSNTEILTEVAHVGYPDHPVTDIPNSYDVLSQDFTATFLFDDFNRLNGKSNNEIFNIAVDARSGGEYFALKNLGDHFLALSDECYVIVTFKIIKSNVANSYITVMDKKHKVLKLFKDVVMGGNHLNLKSESFEFALNIEYIMDHERNINVYLSHLDNNEVTVGCLCQKIIPTLEEIITCKVPGKYIRTTTLDHKIIGWFVNYFHAEPIGGSLDIKVVKYFAKRLHDEGILTPEEFSSIDICSATRCVMGKLLQYLNCQKKTNVMSPHEYMVFLSDKFGMPLHLTLQGQIPISV